MNLPREYNSWTFIGILIFSLLLIGCESQSPVGADKEEKISLKTSKQNVIAENAETPFKVVNQGFNRNISPWVDKSVVGPTGWCGTITKADRRSSDLKPSAGRGFALLSNGTCNGFWSDVYGETYTSGPASGPNMDTGGTSLPEDGFIQELDVYLDPEHPAGVSTIILDAEGQFSPTGDEDLVFTYANSLCTSCELATYDAKYFAVSAIKDGGELFVAGYNVEQAGWYTLRHVFDSDSEGTLTVDFQLKKNDRLLHQKAINETFITGEPTSGLKISNLGSGYIWFTSIADDLQLPIDEHRLRPGK